MSKLFAIALLSVALSAPAFAAHERTFNLDFTVGQVCSPPNRHAVVSVLQITTIEKVFVGGACSNGFSVAVSINFGAVGFTGDVHTATISFTNDADADAFMALWQGRIEDAR